MSTGTLLIRGGRALDPAGKLDRTADVLVRDGRIASVGEDLKAPKDAWVYDADGRLVVPGLLDLHAHLREPGARAAGTIASESEAAVRGGFATVLAMPNTDPPADSEAAISRVLRRGREAGFANVLPVGCITRGRAGKEIAEMERLARAGAVAFSDDGSDVVDDGLMRRALECARATGRPVLAHCEDAALAAGGVMHAGAVSVRLGLSGQPAAAEEAAVERNVRLAEITGGRLHVCHVSTAGSVEIIRRAKARGAPVTAEVTPHHLLLTDEACADLDPVAKVNPPLRTARDAEALLAGLLDGTIDAIATDHAPHAAEDKEMEFEAAAFGMNGLESAVGVLLTKLVQTGKVSVEVLVERLTAGPARVIGRPEAASLCEGADANVTVIDPETAWTIDAAVFRSAGRNCPFQGLPVVGRAVLVVAGGRVHEV